ncbi:MAG: GNAT family N-acetyltransferase [Xanthobacteraceae bacterium]|nr:GNAT family N-acetyltransferase [Xanthobacteraceae bacterium]
MTQLRIVVVDATSDLMPAVYAVRHQVFVGEQAVPPELERDAFDGVAIHLAALHGDHVVGTLRIVVSGGNAKLGRMAVLAAARKAGIGARLMERAHEVARSIRVKEITLHAQLTAREFYARLGYREEGDIFEEAGIAHVSMRKAIG